MTGIIKINIVESAEELLEELKKSENREWKERIQTFKEVQMWLKAVEGIEMSYSRVHHLIQLDNGRLHTGLTLEIPENVILLFQPPYSPQVNPIERLWCID